MTHITSMSAPLGRRRPRRATTRLMAAAVLVTMPLLASCGVSEPEVGAEAVEVVTTTAAPATTTTSTTSTSTSTTSTTSTTTTTTTTTEPPETLPEQSTEPIAPPQDAYGDEPLVEIGSIEIPRIGVNSVLYQGIRLTTLDRGPGHWPGTAMPGQIGNTVVAGHRTSHDRVFRDIDQLQAGDEIIFNTADGRHVYLVTGVQIIEPTDVWIVDPTSWGRATLFACHPPGSTRQRIVAFADLVTT